ncbi:MAG TPA: TolC family protein [Gammaproteobacteria bacterium]|nr:TolC family protein [Gammaproteobacteria bacterium]
MLKLFFAMAGLVVSAIVWADSPAPEIPLAPPELSRWVGSVVAANPRFQAEQAAVEAAQARRRAAGRPLFNPELGLDYERADVDTVSIGISQTLDWADKRSARASVADHEWRVARARLTQRRRELAGRLLRAWARWRTATAIAGVADRQADLMTRFVGLAERRRRAGDLSQVDLDLAHLAASEAKFRQAEAVAGRIRARQSIESLAATEASPPAVALSPPELAEVDIDRLLDVLPTIREAAAMADAARAGVELRQRERRADPTVGLRLGREDRSALGGLSLTAPLFVRNRFKAEVAAAEAEALQAARVVESRRREARARLLAARALYRNARDAWEEWRAAGAPRLRQRTGLLDRLWQAGELRTTDYLVQLKQALETETSAIEQEGRLWEAWIEYLAASGQIEEWLGGIVK